MAFGTRVSFDSIREIAFGSISGSYASVGTALDDHARIVRIVNSTNGEMYISLDGTTDHVKMAANSFVLWDLSTNKIKDDGLFLPIGTQFYVKQSTAPTTGSLWVEVINANGGV